MAAAAANCRQSVFSRRARLNQAIQSARQMLSDMREAWNCPHITIDLRLSDAAGNAPFFARAIKEHYCSVTEPHPKFLIIPRAKYGVAVNVLPPTIEDYWKSLQKTARQNINTARRSGYDVGIIHYNDHLDDIAEINRSTAVRQGPMPTTFLTEPPKPIEDPKSLSNIHAYNYYGVTKNGKLYAYGSCLIAGDAMIMTIIFGHAGYMRDGIVPLLLTGMVADAYANFPNVRYFVYDTYYGGRESFRRFKRKFGFRPHNVKWKL